jgi:hypothetical protein
VQKTATFLRKTKGYDNVAHLTSFVIFELKESSLFNAHFGPITSDLNEDE